MCLSIEMALFVDRPSDLRVLSTKKAISVDRMGGRVGLLRLVFEECVDFVEAVAYHVK